MLLQTGLHFLLKEMVTLHPATGDPAELTGMAHILAGLAGSAAGAVRSGHGGLVVDEQLAHAYLTQRLAQPPPAPTTTVHPPPPQLAGVVRAAEAAGGMQPRRESTTKAARPRRATTRTEEYSHG